MVQILVNHKMVVVRKVEKDGRQREKPWKSKLTSSSALLGFIFPYSESEEEKLLSESVGPPLSLSLSIVCKSPFFRLISIRAEMIESWLKGRPRSERRGAGATSSFSWSRKCQNILKEEQSSQSGWCCWWFHLLFHNWCRTSINKGIAFEKFGQKSCHKAAAAVVVEGLQPRQLLFKSPTNFDARSQ